jgi:hypothetical protein
MPDRRGRFKWIGNINLYMEVLGWDRLLNSIFFHKLGIDCV